MTKKFKVGDLVTAVNTEDEWCEGMTGTIVEIDKRAPSIYRVDFGPQAKYRGHDGGARDGNTWWLRSGVLKPAEDVLTLGNTEEFTTKHFRAGSQTSRILAHLLKGKSITQGECNLVYGGTWRLSDIILKIRKAGFEVATTMKEDEAGHEYASYSLATKAA